MLDDPGLELLSPAGIRNPYAVYDRLRDRTPVTWSAALDAWLVTSHELVREAFRDHSRFSSEGKRAAGYQSLPENVKREVPLIREVETIPVLTTADPPAHTAHRASVSRPLTSRRLEQSREWIEEMCRLTLDDMSSYPNPDIIKNFSEPFAFRVILGIFGAPLELVPLFKEASRTRTAFHALNGATVENAYAYEESLIDLRQALQDLLISTGSSDETLIAALVSSSEQGRLDQDVVFHILRIFFTAAHQNLVYATPVCVLELLRHPEQGSLVRADIKNALGAYEEAIRWEPRTQANLRIAAANTKLGGIAIHQGERLLVFKAAANRDPNAYHNPNTFDACRDQNEPIGGNVSFGQGIHLCVGAGLSRMVGALSIYMLFTRFAHMALTKGWSADYGNQPGMRALTELPVHLQGSRTE